MKHNILLFIFIVLCFSFTQIVNSQGIIRDDFLVNDDSGVASQFEPSIAMDGAGNFVIVWYDFRNANWDIYFQRFNSTGAALGVNIKVNNDSASASQEHPSISMNAAGDFVIAWDDNRNNNYDIYFQRYSSTGAPLGVNTKVNGGIDSAKQWSPSISMNAAGNFVIVWTDERNVNRDIYFQRYTSTGATSGVNTKVNHDAGNADQVSPSISMDVAGGCVIAWQDFRNANWDIYYQRYTSTGTIGANTQANDDAGNGFQMYPSISMDVAGGFVIAWQDFRNANWDIYYQRYTSTGTIGANTQANDDAGSAYQKVPSISIDGVGNFMIVWMDYRYGQTNSDIIGQRYFSSGYPNGVNYRIVADGPNDGEMSPAVCANNSDIIFSWEDNRRSNGRDIYAKIVSWNWNGVTTLIDEGNINPKDFSLSQNYPNPFNPSTTIEYQLPTRGHVTLKVYNLLGQEVSTLVDGLEEPGFKSAQWNASGVASGMYFYRLQAGDVTQTMKLMLLK